MNLRMETLAFLLATLATASPLRAELRVDAQTSDEGELTVFQMTVSPAAAPVPALKERLLLREIDEKPGNAASFYYRAIMMLPDLTKSIRDAVGEDYESWSTEDDFSKIPVDKLRKAGELVEHSSVLAQLREAATRRDCQWGWDLDSVRGPDLYAFLIPEVQQSRALCRLLVMCARLAILDRRFDDALELLRINLKLGRDTAVEPLLVCGLVGVAETGVGNRALVDLIAAPNSPNLYWALAELPQPLIDLRPATRFEMSSVFRVFPALRDAETQDRSAEEWANQLASGLKSVQMLSSNSTVYQDFVNRAGATGMALVTYSSAKQRLIESGMDAQKVEQMPVGQVIAVDAAREFRRLSDGMEKWWYVSYRAARHHDEEIEQMLQSPHDWSYGRILSSLLLPALNAARAAEMRLQWQVDALRVVEAIRMHAAEAGKLPASLDEIKVVPVPENPATGKPYQYRLDGNTAVLELPFSDGFRGQAWRFEIKLAK